MSIWLYSVRFLAAYKHCAPAAQCAVTRLSPSQGVSWRHRRWRRRRRHAVLRWAAWRSAVRRSGGGQERQCSVAPRAVSTSSVRWEPVIRRHAPDTVTSSSVVSPAGRTALIRLCKSCAVAAGIWCQRCLAGGMSTEQVFWNTFLLLAAPQHVTPSCSV